MALDASRLGPIKALAREAHAGQVDKLGRDYFTAHLAPIAAGLHDFGVEAEAAGWLHDIIEDTHHTGDTLRAAGVAEDVVTAVEAVTKVQGESYEGLIERACAEPIGRLVKLVDNTWNLICAPRLAETQANVADDLARRKYLPARERLLSAVGWHEFGPELQRLERLLSSLERELGEQVL